MQLWGPFKAKIWVRCVACTYPMHVWTPTFLGPLKCPSCKTGKEFVLSEPAAD